MKYDFVGVDGNSFSIMGYTANAMKEEGKSDEEVKAYYKEATSGDYHHLLCVSFEMIFKLNEKYPDDVDDEEYEDDFITEKDYNEWVNCPAGIYNNPHYH